jgi:hypothetical protein
MCKPLACPLCQEGRMFLTEMKSKNQAMDNKSYMWICETCPGILLEWWSPSDTDAFVKRLDGDHSDVIKQWEAPEDSTNNKYKDLLKEE